MTFHQPAFLWLLALPVIWGYWHWTRSGHRVVLPFDHGQQRTGRRLGGVINAAESLPMLLLAVAVLFLAGPRRPAPPENERILNNIIICLDVSTSMNALFGGYGRSGNTRFDAAIQAARDFCEYRKGDAFGLTIFGSDFLHWFPPTRELSAIRNALPFVRPNNLPPWFGGTLIAHALRGCKERLARTKEGDRAIILITDGGSADFNNGGDRQIAEELAQHKIRVFTVLIGQDMFMADGVYTVGALTGGKVFRAGDPGALDTIFREIDQMQKAKFKQTTSDWVDYYEPLAWAGMAVCGLWGMTLLGLRFTPW